LVNPTETCAAAQRIGVSYDGLGRGSVSGGKFHFALPTGAGANYNVAFAQVFIYRLIGSRMRIHNLSIAATFLTLSLMAVAASATTTTKHTTNKHTASLSSTHHPSTHTTASSKHSSKHSSKQTVTAHARGQRTIGEERTREIQSALIREHYLTGEPSGVWDAQSKDAMVRYQEANGWQSKVTPDSRALIKLGLGPDHKDLLNPDTAVVASPHELGTVKDALPGGSASQ
jgi:hypothetical protein